MMEQPQATITTALFTDLVSSTDLMLRVGDAAYLSGASPTPGGCRGANRRGSAAVARRRLMSAFEAIGMSGWLGRARQFRER